jgi:hypothetical protein
MIAGARCGHTNPIADDWRALSRFYQDLFGCIPVPPGRDFKGPDLEGARVLPAPNCAASICACPVTARQFIPLQAEAASRFR